MRQFRRTPKRRLILGQAPAFRRHEPKAQKEPVAARRGVVHVLCAAMIGDVVVKHLNITGLDHVLIAQLFREIVDHVECFGLIIGETRYLLERPALGRCRRVKDRW